MRQLIDQTYGAYTWQSGRPWIMCAGTLFGALVVYPYPVKF